MTCPAHDDAACVLLAEERLCRTPGVTSIDDELQNAGMGILWAVDIDGYERVNITHARGRITRFHDKVVPCVHCGKYIDEHFSTERCPYLPTRYTPECRR